MSQGERVYYRDKLQVVMKDGDLHKCAMVDGAGSATRGKRAPIPRQEKEK